MEYIPVPAEGLKFEIKEGQVIIFQTNTGIFNYIAQKLFGKPKVSQIHLDKMGNFIWPLMDGNRDIAAIAILVGDEFKEEAEPLYERIVQYFKILASYGFVKYIQ